MLESQAGKALCREQPVPPCVSEHLGGICTSTELPRWIPSGKLCHEHQYRAGKSIVAADPENEEVASVMTETWFVGVDWGSREHQVCVLDREGKLVSEKQVAHSGSGIASLCSWLEELSDGQIEHVRVAIEVPHGAVVEMLLDRGANVYAINPKQLDRFRDRFTVAGAKDDRRDAWVLADSLRTDQNCFKHLELDSPTLIELKEWSRLVDELLRERTRMGNRMRQQLRRYYPQILELTDDMASEWLLTLWERVPTPEKAARLHKATVAAILKEHRIRRHDADGTLKILREKPLKVSPGTRAAAIAHIRVVVDQLRLANRQLSQAHRRIDELCDQLLEEDDTSGLRREQRDISILRSLPGLGRIVLATLLAEAPKPLHARDYHALRMLTGVAPITKQSGKSHQVIMRRACNRRLRNAMFHWARNAIQLDPICHARYAALRARGHSYARALRSISDRLLGVACAMLKDRTLYDPHHAVSSRDAA